ncbi:IPT/TIG domain-containing protein, partial [Chloroflexota bacterium]
MTQLLFTANSGITFYFDNVNAGSTTTNSNGSFTSNNFTIPSSSPGSHTVKAQDVSSYYATAIFTIMAKITVTPTTGASGTTVTVTGTGFSTSRTITIKYNAVSVTTNPAAISTDSTGNFTATFNVPAGLAGTYLVEATDSTYSDSVNFVATANATISSTTSAASPGYVDMELTVSGTGFQSNTTVTITYSSEPVVLATVTTDGNGAFSASVTIPPSIGGNHTIAVTDGHTTKQYTFVMESNAPPIPAPLLPEEGIKTEAETHFDWDDVDDSSGVSYTFQI